MDGAELRKILINNGYVLKDLASDLGLSQPNFSQLMKVQDVKTGMLENICNVTGKKLDMFYKGTKYYPEELPEQSQESQPVDIKAENVYLKGQLDAMMTAYNSLLRSMSDNQVSEK